MRIDVDAPSEDAEQQLGRKAGRGGAGRDGTGRGESRFVARAQRPKSAPPTSDLSRESGPSLQSTSCQSQAHRYIGHVQYLR